MAHFVKGWSRKHRGQTIRQTIHGTYVAEVNRDNRRKRSTFETLQAARDWLDMELPAREANGTISTSLSARQSRDAMDALALLVKAGLNTSLLSAVGFYAQHHKASAVSWTVEECMRRQLADMESPENGGSPARPRSIQSKRNRLRSFIERNGERKVAEVTSQDVAEWLDATGAKNQNLRNYRTEVQSLFNFAAKRMPGDYHNGVAVFPSKRRKEIRPAEISEPRHIAAVLHYLEQASPRAALGFALGCFAGLRTAEIAGVKGLQWSHVDIDASIIVIPAEVAKSRARREVRIPENLRTWLRAYKGERGRVSVSDANLLRHRRAACKAIGIDMPSNVARHSFGTYFAKLHGYRAAADQMGHIGGIRVFMDHYSGVCTKEQAGAFFDIQPLREV